MKIKMKLKALCMLTLMALMIMACAKKDTESDKEIDTGFVPAVAGNYDSADTAVVIKTDSDAMTITLLNLELGRQYTLSYDGTTVISDKYGSPMIMSQFRRGDVVDVKFMHAKKRLASIKISDSAWYFSGITNYTLSGNDNSLTFGEDVYKLSKDLIVATGEGLLNIEDIHKDDVVTIVGIDRTVHSIIVDKGHGFLSVMNVSGIKDGWLEIGHIITPVQEGMLLTVPEGEYNVLVSCSGVNESIPVVIKRNEETELDLSVIKVEEASTGMVIFNVTPSTATVYIDSVETDVSKPVYLSTGIHQIILQAPGYVSSTQYIKVGTVTSTLDFTLDEIGKEEEKDKDDKDTEKDKEDKESEDKDTEDKDADEKDSDDSKSEDTGEKEKEDSAEDKNENTPPKEYLVYIESPEETEIYVDGVYIGIAPLSFPKKEGSYVITLRRTGYQTRSYSISIDGDNKDATYNFAPLLSLNE